MSRKLIANLSKSRRHPDNQFRSATLEVQVDGDTVTIADFVVDDSGHEFQGRNTILVDGNEHGSAHADGYVLMARWRGSLIVSGDQQMIVLDRFQL